MNRFDGFCWRLLLKAIHFSFYQTSQIESNKLLDRNQLLFNKKYTT